MHFGILFLPRVFRKETSSILRKVRERADRGKFGGRWLKLELLTKTNTKEISKALTITMANLP